jgi:hypothetical protein
MAFQTIHKADGSVEYLDSRTISEAKSFRIEIIRQATNQAVIESGLDESTQQNAALGIYSPERCEAIKSYIASCRNEYLRCKALILAAQTNDEADAVSFSAPSVPQNLGS